MIWLQGDENYAPSYCECCGEPYPWLKTAIEAAAELIYEESGVSDEDKNKLIESLSDLWQKHSNRILPQQELSVSLELLENLLQKASNNLLWPLAVNL